MVRVGCSGWSYPHWRGKLYPASGSTARWLEIYADSFDTVEVNSSFYRLPRVDAVARWTDTTPKGFCFAVKASRYLTHVRRLHGVREGVARLEGRLRPFRTSRKLGPILWQLPSTFHRDDERLRNALLELPKGRHAFEFRHESWFVDPVYELLRQRDVALVVADRAPDKPSPWVETTGWTYVRFHAGRGRNGKHTRRQLTRWAERLGATRGDAYVYFNNDWEGFAIEDARALRSLLS